MTKRPSLKLNKMLGLLRNTLFVSILLIGLISSTIAVGIWGMTKAVQVASLTAAIADNAITHSKQTAKTVFRTKAKARLKRLIAATPFVGIAAVGYFEEQDYKEWLLANPEGDRKQYACEVAIITAEVLDEVLQDLPDNLRPNPKQLFDYLSLNESCNR